jgi:xanthosine utilization system XapX-like protein
MREQILLVEWWTLGIVGIVVACKTLPWLYWKVRNAIYVAWHSGNIKNEMIYQYKCPVCGRIEERHRSVADMDNPVFCGGDPMAPMTRLITGGRGKVAWHSGNIKQWVLGLLALAAMVGQMIAGQIF